MHVTALPFPDLLDRALQLAPQPGLAAQMPEHSVQLAATLTSQRVTQYRADADGGEPDAASRLAMALNNLSVRLGDQGRREEALAAIQGAVTIRRELAARWPDAYGQELERSLQVIAWLQHRESHASLGEAQCVITVRYHVLRSSPFVPLR